MSPPIPILTIAGSDCSAGAGIQADLKTISALGGFALTAVTSVVSEIPGRVSKVQLMPPDLITDQVKLLFEAFPIASAKVGMVGGRQQIQATTTAWLSHGHGLPLVVDPVMIATGGGRLLEDDAVECLLNDLLPLATVITPNMSEAEALWGHPVTSQDSMTACASELSKRLRVAVLVKGGHLPGPIAADVLVSSDGIHWMESERTPNVHTHGTGCTFSAALATLLGQGHSLVDAAHQAKQFISRSISQHFAWPPSNRPSLHALNHLHQHLS